MSFTTLRVHLKITMFTPSFSNNTTADYNQETTKKAQSSGKTFLGFLHDA